MFDPENRIVKICAEGLQYEEDGLNAEAIRLYNTAWEEATSELEKFVASHYVARLQPTIEEKLEWDLKCLHLLVSIRHDEKRTWLSLILLNVGKGHEAIGKLKDAKSYYLLAKMYERFVSDDEAGRKVVAGIQRGLNRLS